MVVELEGSGLLPLASFVSCSPLHGSAGLIRVCREETVYSGKKHDMASESLVLFSGH